jgi:DNA-binding LytR/AlgR family response regulator
MPTALIAEDEPLLAEALQDELALAWPELQIAAVAGDGVSAVQQTLALKPDVLLFDIRMPEMSGLDAAAELTDAWDEASGPFPALVFVTAYNKYAVQAFEMQALDYVLKPVQQERLQKTVQKLRRTLEQRALLTAHSTADSALGIAAVADQLRLLLTALQPDAAAAATPLTQLQVSPAGTGGNTIRMVPIDDVLYLQAADKYVRAITATDEYLLRTSLKDLLPQLDKRQFWQIHRSTLVRAKAIDTVRRDEFGKLYLTLRGGTGQLVVSNLYAHLFKAM